MAQVARNKNAISQWLANPITDTGGLVHNQSCSRRLWTPGS